MDDAKLPNPAESTDDKERTGQSQLREINDTVWLSVEQIRKRERMRRELVIEAMSSGALPFEQRGRARYARLCDVIRWEESRLRMRQHNQTTIRTDLRDLL